MVEPLVRVDRVCKSFPEGTSIVHALRNITFDVDEGEFLALSGPSGSGKTTLLNLIGGLARPTSGSILVARQPLGKLGLRQLTFFRRRKIGFIFQDFNLLPALNCADNIAYALWLLGVDGGERKRRIHEIAERFGIVKLLDRLPSQISRGQQQRVAVARAVVHRPQLVLGDEFTANLDQATGAALMDFLLELNQHEGITFVFTTHDPVMLARALRIVRLQDGRTPPAGGSLLVA